MAESMFCPSCRGGNARQATASTVRIGAARTGGGKLPAPAAQAIPIRRPGAVSPSDLDGVGAIPPGLFRRIVSEKWAHIVDQTCTRRACLDRQSLSFQNVWGGPTSQVIAAASGLGGRPEADRPRPNRRD